MENTNNKILIFTATYNESENITNFLDSIDNLNLKLDVLIIDDNSPDKTSEIIENYSKNKKNIHLIKRSKKESLYIVTKFANDTAAADCNNFVMVIQCERAGPIYDF